MLPQLRQHFYSQFLLALILSVFSLPLLAQATLTPVSHILPDAIAGNTYVPLSFGVTDPPNGDDNITYEYSWKIVGTTNKDSTNTFIFTEDTGLSLVRATSEEATGEITGTVNSRINLETGDYRITVYAVQKMDTIATRKYFLLVSDRTPCNTQPQKISLLLDASGSMNTPTTTSDGSPNTRWGELQAEVNRYVPNLQTWMKDSDSLQVIHFQGNTAREITDERFDDTNWNMPGEVQETIFGNQAITPSGQTPLGDAIEALSSFHSNPTPDDTRHATIVFTDGHENGCPRVFVPVNNCSRVVHKVNNQKAVIEKATFYAIGVSGSDETLLNRIAADLGTPGTSAYTLNPEDVQLLFECTIPELFRGCTPRIITFKRGTTPNTPPNRLTESFRVDSLVRKLTINLRCRSGNCGFNDDGLELRRNGRPVNARPTFVANDEIRYAIDLPLIDTTAGTALDGGGAWTLLCPATRGSDYELMVMVDDKRLAVNTTVNNNQAVYAGDPITVRTEATYLGRAFNGLEAEAFLLAPGEDPGALFATTNIDPPAPQEPSPGPGMSLGSLQAQAKISGLLVREDILARLAYRSNGIPLTRTADGRFTGTFPAPLTEVSSHYRIMVRYKGYQVGLDSIQGMTIDHFHVRFGRSEEIDLNAKVVKTGTGDQLTSYRYQFRPTNKFGNPVGPAQAQNISVLVDGKPTILQDQLDGTYTTNVNTAYGGRPKVAVYVNDRNKPVSKRRLGPAIGLSLHSGILRMRQAPAPYDGLPDGTYYEADLTARLTGSFDLEAIVGQNDFGDNLRILEAGLFAGLTLPQPAIAGFKPRIQAGLSYFKPDALDGQLGGGARLGLARFFGPNLQIGLEGGGSYLFDSELLFLKGGLFIKYFF